MYEKSIKSNSHQHDKQQIDQSNTNIETWNIRIFIIIVLSKYCNLIVCNTHCFSSHNKIIWSTYHSSILISTPMDTITPKMKHNTKIRVISLKFHAIRIDQSHLSISQPSNSKYKSYGKRKKRLNSQQE